MVLDLTRIPVWLIISIFIVHRIMISKIIKKTQVSIIAVILCLLLVSATTMFPVENLFFTFKSPESAFYYMETGRIDAILQGQESCMVIYTEGVDEFGWSIIPKTEAGYKLPTYWVFATKKVVDKFDEDGLFDIRHVIGTKDYYFGGTVNPNGVEYEVFNEKNEKQECSIYRAGGGFTYFYLEDFNNEYYLMADGNKILLSNNEDHY